MKGQIIPMNRDAFIDDEIIRLVNEHHEESKRKRYEEQQRAVAEQQARDARRRYLIEQALNNLCYAVAGAIAMLTFLIFAL